MSVASCTLRRRRFRPAARTCGPPPCGVGTYLPIATLRQFYDTVFMRQDDSVSVRSIPATRVAPARPRSPAGSQRTLAADPPRARSLIVTVWGDALAPHGGARLARRPDPADGAVRLQRALGAHQRVPAGARRLARRRRRTGRRSRYRLTRDGARRFDEAHQPHLRPPADTHWHGEWEIVLAPPDAASAARRRALRDELAWAGFGALGPPAPSCDPRTVTRALPSGSSPRWRSPEA